MRDKLNVHPFPKFSKHCIAHVGRDGANLVCQNSPLYTELRQYRVKGLKKSRNAPIKG